MVSPMLLSMSTHFSFYATEVSNCCVLQLFVCVPSRVYGSLFPASLGSYAASHERCSCICIHSAESEVLNTSCTEILKDDYDHYNLNSIIIVVIHHHHQRN